MSNFRDELVDKILQCNPCYQGYSLKKLRGKEKYDLFEWLHHNLPAVNYVVSVMVNNIMSNNLTTGDKAQDKRLDEFLYTKRNINGVPNFTVIQSAITEMLVYGRSGIRLLDEQHGLMNVKYSTYATLKMKNEEFMGFEELIGYLLSDDGKKTVSNVKLGEGFDFDEEQFKKNKVLYLKDKNLILEDTSKFINLRRNVQKDEGESPFEYDIQRLLLLANVYKRLNYDVEYDGPGRLLFWMNKDYSKILQGTDITSGEMIETNQSEEEIERQRKQLLHEIDTINNMIKNSDDKNVMAISSVFEKMDHLPRITKSTEFLNYLMTKEGEILSQVFGMPPQLLGVSKISGNISMEKIIDNAMVNSIIPIREQIAVQLSSVLAPFLGVEKIYFDKYELRQKQDENVSRYNVAKYLKLLNDMGKDELVDRLIKEEFGE